MLETRTMLSAEALRIATDVGDPWLQFWAADYSALCALQHGRRDEADRHINTMASMTDHLRQPTLRWLTGWAISAQHFLDGDLNEAERVSTEAFQVAMDCGQPDAVTTYGAQLAVIRLAQGRAEEVLPLVEQSAALNDGVRAFRGLLASFYCATDRDADAIRLLDDELADGWATLPYDALWLSALTLWSDVAASTDHSDAAKALVKLLAPFTEQLVHVGIVGHTAVAFAIGQAHTVLGDYDRALAAFATARDIHQRVRAPYFIARSDLAEAITYAKRGTPQDRRTAEAFASKALLRANDHGFGQVERSATKLLNRLDALWVPKTHPGR
jgi:tetratricopeptide (TPR) repeat protein